MVRGKVVIGMYVSKINLQAIFDLSVGTTPVS